MIDKKTSKVFKRIARNMPERLKNGIVKTVVDTSEEDVARAAMNEPGISKKNRAILQREIDRGAFRRSEDIEDEKVIKEIDQYNEREVKKAIARGEIPPPQNDSFISKRQQRMKKSTKLENKLITPVKNRIVVKPTEPDTKTKSGILIPDSNKKKPAIGTVVAIGPQVSAVSVKQQIAFEDYNYEVIEIKKQQYYIMKEDSILAILHENN